MLALWRRSLGAVAGRARPARPLSSSLCAPAAPTNLTAWIAEHGAELKPPVANRLIYGKESALKVMVVGGPNQRRDYHVQAGEEFFIQLAGQLVLKVIEQGRHRDILLNAGESFLLPSNIPHSPQRTESVMYGMSQTAVIMNLGAGSIGLVFERSHTNYEMDGMMWLKEGSDLTKFTRESIEYEEYFNCTDLGTQLKPVIERYEAWRASGAAPVLERWPPAEIDSEATCEAPTKLERHLVTLGLQAGPDLLHRGDEVVCEAHVGPRQLGSPRGAPFDIFVWQRRGASDLTLFDTEAHHTLQEGDTFLIPKGAKYDSKIDPGAVLLSIANAFT